MTIDEIRSTKRNQIENFFRDNMGAAFSSSELHMMFGPAFRSRVSEINRDPGRSINIRNHYQKMSTWERSTYYGEEREDVAEKAA